jgi:hypothetical protein
VTTTARPYLRATSPRSSSGCCATSRSLLPWRSRPTRTRCSMVRVPWLTAAAAATHRSGSPAACSGLPSGPEESRSPRRVGADKRLRWRSGSCLRSPIRLRLTIQVVELHDFVTPAEAAAFQRVCKPHFERSLAGDQLNPVRTSFQCWCNFPGCFMDEDVHRVTRRINHVTGTNFDNGEDIQIVRYEPGQFYKVHHDQNTAVWAPQGPRVLTFFMYLNTPEGGGETWFPQVNNVNGSRGIMVQPRAGSAILWPSTLDAAPMHADHRTNHAAQPVTQGIKFGANMWIHQFDFKTPSERGCQLTYVNTVGNVPRDPEHIKLTKGYVPDYETGVEPGLRAA